MDKEEQPLAIHGSNATVAETTNTQPKRAYWFCIPLTPTPAAIASCIIYTALATYFFIDGIYTPGAACTFLALVCLLGIYMTWSDRFLSAFAFGCAHMALQLVIWIIIITAIETYDCNLVKNSREQIRLPMICASGSNLKLWIVIFGPNFMLPTYVVFLAYAVELRVKELRARSNPDEPIHITS